jgi:hypothetical protein
LVWNFAKYQPLGSNNMAIGFFQAIKFHDLAGGSFKALNEGHTNHFSPK